MTGGLRIPFRAPGPREMWAAMVERQRQLLARLEDPAVQAEIAAARSEAAAAARVLRGRFGATRVVLFGSLARGVPTEDFDIDLAVEGVEPARFFTASAAANHCVTRELDVIPIEDAPPLLRQRIEEDGVELP